MILLVLLFYKKGGKSMGFYLNPDNELFKKTVNSEIYVDKTMLIEFTNSVLNTEQQEICVSRPRRFGKSITENMLVAYYSKGCDSKELFSKFKISGTHDFEKYLNCYNVIHINIQEFVNNNSIKEIITNITDELLFHLKTEFNSVKFFKETDLFRALKDIFVQIKQKFIFIIDEWDCIFRINKNNVKEHEEYLNFLRDLLKNQPYVVLVYMTGILPIKKIWKTFSIKYV